MPQQEEEKKVGTFLYYQERMGGNEVVDKQREREATLLWYGNYLSTLPHSIYLHLSYSPFIILLFSSLLCSFLLQGIQIPTLKFSGRRKFFLKFLWCCFSTCRMTHSRLAYRKVSCVTILAANIIDIWYAQRFTKLSQTFFSPCFAMQK